MIGIVMNCNNEIGRVLGYTKNEILGQNISRIQPKCYADYHDNILRTYLENAESKNIGVERLILPQAKNGYVVGCSLMVKVYFFKK